MPAPHILIPRVILGVAGAAALVDAVLYAIALVALSSGPDRFGYEILLYANKAAGIVAVLAVAVVAARTFAGGRILVPSLGLLLASGITGGIALGLYLLGTVLASIAPDLQPMQLASMLLAVRGSGQDLAVVPLFLAVGAAVQPFIGLLRARRVSPVFA